MPIRKNPKSGTRRGSCRSETLAACGNVQGYIKALIRADVSAPTEDANAR